MALTAVALIVLVTTCFVRGQVNLLSTDFKPPPPPPPSSIPKQQTAASSSIKQPFNLPPLLPPQSNKISHSPFGNQQTLPPKYPPPPNTQFPPQLPPTLPPQLQSQLPIQLPQHFQQQLPYTLQPQFAIQPPSAFPPHIPPFLHNGIKSALLPPQFPSNLPTKFPSNPPPPPPPPQKQNFQQLPPPKSSNPPFPSLSVHSGTKNISIQANRAPRTLQMIGSGNGQTFHKIGDNLRPGHPWYYKTNTIQKRPPHPQAPKLPSGTTPSPLLHAPRLIPLNQFNQLEQITKLNQQNQPPISLNHWQLTNNQHLNTVNTIAPPWNGGPNFNQGPQYSNSNNQNFNSHGSTPLKTYDHSFSNSNSPQKSNNQNLNNYGSSQSSYENFNSSPNLNSIKSLNNQNLNSHGFSSLNSSPNSNSFKSLSNINVNSNHFDSYNSSPNLDSYKSSNLNSNNNNNNNNNYDSYNSSPNLSGFKTSNNQNGNSHASSYSNSSPNLSSFKTSNNQNANGHASPLNSYDTSKPSSNLNNFKSSSNQNSNNQLSSLSSGYDTPTANNNVKSTTNQNYNGHGPSYNSFSNASSTSSFTNLKNTNNQNLNNHGFSSLSSGYDSSPSGNSNSNFKSSSNQNVNSHGSSSSSHENLNSSPGLGSLKSNSVSPASYLHINVHSDPPQQNTNQPSYSSQQQYSSLNQSPYSSSFNQQSPFTSHQQSSSFYPNAPVTPQEVFKDTTFQISAITIPEPEKPQFDTLRSQVSALKAKHRDFFGDHKNGDSTQHNTIPSFPSFPSYPTLQSKPAYGSTKPPPSQSLSGLNPWTPMDQNKLTPSKWNAPKFEYSPSTSSFALDHEQYTTPKKTLPLKNDFVGFPPAKGSIKNELNFISNWEKGIGIITKHDHGDAEKGQTILSSGDTDDFKKIDKNQNKQETNKVEVISLDQMHRKPTGRNETTKKLTNLPKKTYGKGKPLGGGKKGRETSEEQKSEEITTVRQELPNGNGGEMNDTQLIEPRYRKRRDLSGDGSTTESIVVSPESANTAAPILEPKTELESNQPRAEPLVAPATESVEAATGTRNVKALVAERRDGDVLDSSEEAALFLDLEDYDVPRAEALTRYNSVEGDILSDEDLDEADSGDMSYDDYDDAYLDDDNEEPTIQSRSDTFIFEELDGTTSRPEAVPMISERVDNFDLSPQSEALVDPRNLHGRDLIYFLDEAIRNSSQFLPDEAEDRSFDVVDPPKDVIKFPYYDRTEAPINVDSALRFAENLTTFSKGLYESKNGNQCHEVDIELPEEPAESNADGFLPIRRLKRLGSKVDCLKNKHFGKEPLDNPLFKEEFVGAGRSSLSDPPAPQPDPSVAVFSDVIRLIKQHLDEEERTKAKEFNDVVTPRQLNLPDGKTPSPNNAVLEQLRLGKRRPLLPNKQTKKVEEPKTETSQNTTSEAHGLKIVFPRRLNITKTYDEAKKSKSKPVDIEGYKAKLNHSRTGDHESYKSALARKLNFDKLDKSKIPKSQRRDSDDGLTYDPPPQDTSQFMPVFDINSFYPKFAARDDEELSYPLTEKGFATKYDELEREADELISSVRRSSAESERRSANAANTRAENAKKLKDKPYGTSYSPSYQQYRLLSRKDDQKKTPTVDELVDFYSRRRSIDSYEQPYEPALPPADLSIFDVSSFYPRFVDRGNDDKYQPKPSIKRKDSKITLEDLETLQAPKHTPKSESTYNSDVSKPTAAKQVVRDDIADFYEGSHAQQPGSKASLTSNDGHHTFKKSEPPNPDLPETDKATFHLDQPAVGTNQRTHRLHPAKVIPRKQYKTIAKHLKRPPVKYRRKKVFTGYFN